jgi:hypothetical protein
VRGRERIHFLHIGKTGGTAVRHALESAAPSRYEFVFHPHAVTLADVPGDDRVVFFLRDPLSRFTSGFWSRFRQGLPRYPSPWSDDEMRAFVRFRTPNDLAVSLPGDEAVQAMKAIEHVRSWQSDWLEGLDNNRIFAFGFTESLATDFAALTERLGVVAQLPTDPVAAHRNPEWLDRQLSDQAVENLRGWYSRDLELIDQLHGVTAR